MSWIHEEYELRRAGRGRALSQSQHAEINAVYPGLTIHTCANCDQPTGYSDCGMALCAKCIDECENKELNHD